MLGFPTTRVGVPDNSVEWRWCKAFEMKRKKEAANGNSSSREAAKEFSPRRKPLEVFAAKRPALWGVERGNQWFVSAVSYNCDGNHMLSATPSIQTN
jgi:hypothetical protein